MAFVSTPKSLLPVIPKAVESKDKDFSDFSAAKAVYQRLIDNWAMVSNTTERNRLLRFQKGTDSQDLRNQGVLKQDEMYNPVRIIDTNIRREQPQYINYLTQSRRSIIFAPEDEETVDGIEKLEQDFTKKARYLGWEIPFIRCIDGAQTHGWDSVEIVFDALYPGNFCFHHVGHENLIFATDSEDINFQEVLLRKERLSSSQLKSYVTDQGWDDTQVTKLIEACRKDSVEGDEVNCVCYKIFFKSESIIMTAWMSPLCDEYFTVPKPLFLGIRDTEQAPALVEGATEAEYPKQYETEYPFTIYKYIESEDPIITNLTGRSNLDEATQEAASAMSSALVNGIVRASNVYASPLATNINGNPNAAPMALAVTLKHGAIYDQPLSFFNTPWPDPGVIQAIQAVVTQNQQEQSQVNFSVLNRKDSGKTATEINAATQKSGELSSVQIILISIFIRQAYAKAWRVYQNRVLQEKIKVSLTLLPLFGDVILEPADPSLFSQPGVMMTPEAIVASSQPTRLATPRKYIVKSSGDVDVVQRAENLQRKMQAWPVLMNTPLAGEFLKDILRASFPEDAERYIKVLDTAARQGEAQLKVMLGQVANVLKAIVTGPDGQIKPEYQAQAGQLQQLAAHVAEVLNAPSSSQPGQNVPAQGQSQPQPPNSPQQSPQT